MLGRRMTLSYVSSRSARSHPESQTPSTNATTVTDGFTKYALELQVEANATYVLCVLTECFKLWT